VARSLHALADVLETARIHRLTRHQHILFRLGELIAYAECAASLARRAARAAEGQLNPKASLRFGPVAQAAFSRVFAREAASRILSEGMRWIGGAAGAHETAELEKRLNATLVYQAQAGLLRDMDHVADILYDRKETP
jgi:alkylation response protein AidB-like acyl-CoA dehydrogenase